MSSEAIFSKITIIGAGLIGSSLSRAIKRAKACDVLVLADQNEGHRKAAQDLGLADHIEANNKRAVQGSDLVVLATPIGSFETILKEIAPHLKQGSVLSDVGSVKGEVARLMGDIIPETVNILPAHPISGTENSGPEAGFESLFDNRWLIIAPLEGRASEQATARLKQLWQACGSFVEVMPINHHDDVLSMTSHLPHLVAFSIMNTAADMEEETRQEILKFSAGGFRDFTRVAASNPTMWRDIFLQNKDALLPLLQRFVEDLTILQKFIRREDGQELYNYIDKARNLRRSMTFDVSKQAELGRLGDHEKTKKAG